MKKVVLYMRYSSLSQSEQSIEGQEADITQYCKAKKYKIVGKYIDRATSASKDISKRKEFLRMIEDSSSGAFEAVVIWSFDRFARNRKDSSIYRSKLKANGVELISIKEDIPNAPVGIIMEGLFDAMAEYYSAELSVKVRRGIKQSALKHKALGGIPILGYKSDKDKNIVIDPDTKQVVKDVFRMYASGVHVKDICSYLSEMGIKTTYGNEITATSLRRMLSNERYIGTYTYKGHKTENAIPAIIDKDTWNACQVLLNSKSGYASYSDYLVAGKLYCGLCGAKMKAYGGKSHTNQKYRYYNCENHNRKNKNPDYCAMQPIKKELLEDAIVNNTVHFFSQLDVDAISKRVYRDLKDFVEKSTVTSLEKEIKDIEKVIDNIVDSLALAGPSERLLNRLEENEEILKELKTKYEAAKSFMPTQKEISDYLKEISQFDDLSEETKRDVCKTAIKEVVVKREGNTLAVQVEYYAIPSNIVDKLSIEKPSNPMESGLEGGFKNNTTGADDGT